MTILGLSDVSDVQSRTYQERQPAPIETPWYKGLGTGIVQGVEHAFDVAGASTDDDFERRAKEIRESRPDPVKVGAAGQILHGFSSIAAYGVIGAAGGAPVGAAIGAGAGALAGGVGAIPGAAAGAAFGAKSGAAASIGYLSGVDRYFELIDQGVDHDTATQAAGITGVVMAAGAAAPAYIGKTLGRQVLSGVGINVGLGATERGATGALLEEQYAKVAEHYKALDAQGMVLDAVLGAAFPLGGRFLGRMFKQEELDAAMTKQHDIAGDTRNPGLESSLENVENFRAALPEADRQILLEGRTVSQVDLPAHTADIPNPEFGAMMRNFDDAVSEHIARDFGVSVDDVRADIQRALDLDTEVRNAVQDRIAKAMDVQEQVAAKEKGATDGELTPDVFARQDAEAVAKVNPDIKVADADGNVISAENIGKFIDDTVRKGKEDTFLHNVAISCYLTHGD